MSGADRIRSDQAIRDAREPIAAPLRPETAYEREGDVGYVTFPCRYTLDADGDGINLYYGAADTSVALAKGSITQILSWLDRHGTV